MLIFFFFIVFLLIPDIGNLKNVQRMTFFYFYCACYWLYFFIYCLKVRFTSRETVTLTHVDILDLLLFLLDCRQQSVLLSLDQDIHLLQPVWEPLVLVLVITPQHHHRLHLILLLPYFCNRRQISLYGSEQNYDGS